MLLPTEWPESKIDCDSNVSYNLNEGIVHHMAWRVLTIQFSWNLLEISAAEDVGKESDKNAEEENVADEKDTETPKKRGRKIKKKSKRAVKWKENRENIH